MGVTQALIDDGKLGLLQQMYKEWPFFSVTMDMIEMVFAKADPRVAQARPRSPLLTSSIPIISSLSRPSLLDCIQDIAIMLGACQKGCNGCAGDVRWES